MLTKKACFIRKKKSFISKPFKILGNCSAHKLRIIRHTSLCFSTKLNHLASKKGFHLSSQQLDAVKLSLLISIEINLAYSWGVRLLIGRFASLPKQSHFDKALFGSSYSSGFPVFQAIMFMPLSSQRV